MQQKERRKVADSDIPGYGEKANFTGQITDMGGRRQCYQDGQHVACPGRDEGEEAKPRNAQEQPLLQQVGAHLMAALQQGMTVEGYASALVGVLSLPPEELLLLKQGLLQQGLPPEYEQQGSSLVETFLADLSMSSDPETERQIQAFTIKRWSDGTPKIDPSSPPLLVTYLEDSPEGLPPYVTAPLDREGIQRVLTSFKFAVRDRWKIINYLGLNLRTADIDSFGKSLERMVFRHYNPPIGERIAHARDILDLVTEVAHMGYWALDDRDILGRRISKYNTDLTNRGHDLVGWGSSYEKLRKDYDLLAREQLKIKEMLRRSHVKSRDKSRSLIQQRCQVPDAFLLDVRLPEGFLSSPAAFNLQEALNFLKGIVSPLGAGEILVISCFSLLGERERLSAGSLGVNPFTTTSTFLHLLGHFLEGEGGIPSLGETFREFLYYRVAGENSERMASLFAGSLYQSDEMVRKDRFDRALGERAGWYAGKEYATGHTEILPMFLEKIYSEPSVLCQKDPEYACFGFGMLNGTLRNKPIPDKVGA